MSEAEKVIIPSWMRWPPNCCETCTGWSRIDEWTGKCNQSSLVVGEITDARYRCQYFIRKPEDANPNRRLSHEET